MKMMNISNHRKQNAIPLKGLTVALPAAGIAVVMASCMSLRGSSSGGEVTGVGGSSMAEPTPYGMVLIDRGAYAMGPSKNDSAAGIRADAKPVSVDAFWMDETEITNSKYKQFVFWVRDSIIRERLADPAYGGNEAFKIEEDKEDRKSVV